VKFWNFQEISEALPMSSFFLFLLVITVDPVYSEIFSVYGSYTWNKSRTMWIFWTSFSILSINNGHIILISNFDYDVSPYWPIPKILIKFETLGLLRRTRMFRWFHPKLQLNFWKFRLIEQNASVAETQKFSLLCNKQIISVNFSFFLKSFEENF
jgi:hypothetical protein